MANRELLKTIMHAHGFTILPTEWWHYDFDGWRNYQLADIPFTAL
jgi:D-alanyl-D-alanine dipeptidase